MNFSVGANTPESLSCSGRRQLAVVNHLLQSHCSPFSTYLLRRKSESEGSRTSSASYRGSAAGNLREERRRAEISARKLAAEKWKFRFGSTRGTFDNFNHQMESATKWDCECSKGTFTSNCYPKNLLEDKPKALSAISILQSEFLKAQSRIHQLETKQVLSKKKMKHTLRKTGHGKESDVQSIISFLQHKLGRERKERKRMEVVNSRLLDELAEAKLFMKEIIQDYDEEKRERDSVEEICYGLVRKIGALKKEMVKLRDEVEEEKAMLQMAEVWREERVKMKLVDAKLALEDKYNEMNELVTELEMFLRSTSGKMGKKDSRKAQVLRSWVEAVSTHDMKEFEYVEPKPGDASSMFREIQENGAGERY